MKSINHCIQLRLKRSYYPGPSIQNRTYTGEQVRFAYQHQGISLEESSSNPPKRAYWAGPITETDQDPADLAENVQQVGKLVARLDSLAARSMWG